MQGPGKCEVVQGCTRDWETTLEDDNGDQVLTCGPHAQALLDESGWDPYPDPYNL